MVKKVTLESFKNIAVFIIILTPLLVSHGCSFGDQLNSLVEKGKFREAALIYELDIEYFRKYRDKNIHNLKLVAENLNQSYEDDLQSHITKLHETSWPAEKTKWLEIKEELRKTSELLDEYNGYAILQEKDFRSSTYDSVQELVGEITKNIKQGAATAFLNFNHFRDESFFDIYPVSIEPRAFMSNHFEHISPILKSASTEEIRKFTRLYHPHIMSSETIYSPMIVQLKQQKNILGPKEFESVSNFYVGACLREKTEGSRPDFKTLVDVLKAVKESGYTPSKVPGIKLGFVQVVNEELTQFPIQLIKDLPFDVTTVDCNDIAIQEEAEDHGYVVIFHILDGIVERKVNSREEISSTFQSGTVPVSNPNYENAKFNVIDCQNRLNQLMSLNSQNPNLFALFAISSVRKQLNNAMLQMQNIPAYIDKPIYENYKYSRVEIGAKKILRAKCYVIDSIENSYFSKDVSFTQKEDFTILYGVNKNDTKLWSNTDTEQELEEWTKTAIDVTTSDITEHCKVSSTEDKKIISFEAVEDEMRINTSSIIEKLQANNATLFDPKFECVVVIINPTGTISSGFFVKPDIVLTNYHAVEGVKYVEIKTYGKQETFGKVERFDIRLDLALIKVQARGKPVKLYDGTGISPGDTVDAIGHPKGLEFSMTRGVISAVRKIPSIYAPDADDVLFIQTDAAVNPGNSGGPLFLKDEVVGVNTQKMVKTEIEGLGFAVHYSEVLRFIRGE